MFRIPALCSLLLLVSLSVGEAAEPKKKVLLIGQGPDGHPPQTHEYVAGIRIVGKLLERTPNLELMIARGDEPWKEGPELIDRADAVVLFVSEGAKWLQADAKRLAAFQRLAKRGGGLVALHWAIGTKDAKPIDDYLKLLGGCHGGPDRKYKVLETDVQVADPKHPIAAGLAGFKVREEFYYRLKFVAPEGSIKPVLTATIEDAKETVAWSWERPDGGRSFGFSGLHFHENWARPEYRRLVAQAVLWSLKKPIPEKGLPVELPESELKVK